MTLREGERGGRTSETNEGGRERDKGAMKKDEATNRKEDGEKRKQKERQWRWDSRRRPAEELYQRRKMFVQGLDH